MQSFSRLKVLGAAILLALSGAAGAAETWRAAGAAPMPAGAVVYFATPGCPAGWLEANGMSFRPQAYPALYAVIGGVLPDLRGEFIRGLDRQRGIDPGRTMGSVQSDAVRGLVPGAIVAASPAGVDGNVSVAAPVGSEGETRPRNMALLACISTGS